MKAKVNRYADSERSEELKVMVSPKALRLLTALAARRGMSCEALAREYLTRGLVDDRLKAFAESASTTVEDVLREHVPAAEADALITEVRRRFAETG